MKAGESLVVEQNMQGEVVITLKDVYDMVGKLDKKVDALDNKLAVCQVRCDTKESVKEKDNKTVFSIVACLIALGSLVVAIVK